MSGFGSRRDEEDIGVGSQHYNNYNDDKVNRRVDFRCTMKSLNQTFINACQDEVTRAPDCVLVPLIQNYLLYLRDTLTKLNEDPSDMDVNSFTNIGKFYDSITKKLNGISHRMDKPVFNNNNKEMPPLKRRAEALGGPPSTGGFIMGGFKPFTSSPPGTGFAFSTPQQPGTSVKPLTGFSFSSAANFSSPMTQTGVNSKGNDDEDAEPPKNEFNPVAKSDFLYNVNMGKKLNGISHRMDKPVFNYNNKEMPPLKRRAEGLEGLSSAAGFNVGGFKPFASSPPGTGLAFSTPQQPTTSVKPLTGFSFSPAANFSSPTTQTGVNSKDSDDEDAEPPKNEFTPVVESDSLYNVKCKVFYMAGGSYKDKGVGQLYVKKLDSGKYQLVVRADNTLGTVLLNLLLSKSLPLNKKSAKDIITVDPQGNKGEPATVLIRVKDESSATELLNKLTQFKSSSS